RPHRGERLLQPAVRKGKIQPDGLSGGEAVAFSPRPGYNGDSPAPGARRAGKKGRPAGPYPPAPAKGVSCMSFDPYEFDRSYARQGPGVTMGQYAYRTFLWMFLGLMVTFGVSVFL